MTDLVRLYIGKLPDGVTKGDLDAHFHDMTSFVKDMWVARNPGGFAFVRVPASQVEDFVTRYNGTDFKGSHISVERAKADDRQGRGGMKRQRQVVADVPPRRDDRRRESSRGRDSRRRRDDSRDRRDSRERRVSRDRRRSDSRDRRRRDDSRDSRDRRDAPRRDDRRDERREERREERRDEPRRAARDDSRDSR